MSTAPLRETSDRSVSLYPYMPPSPKTPSQVPLQPPAQQSASPAPACLALSKNRGAHRSGLGACTAASAYVRASTDVHPSTQSANRASCPFLSLTLSLFHLDLPTCLSVSPSIYVSPSLAFLLLSSTPPFVSLLPCLEVCRSILLNLHLLPSSLQLSISCCMASGNQDQGLGPGAFRVDTREPSIAWAPPPESPKPINPKP